MTSLLAWASSAYSTPSPLPARSDRRKGSGAWPLGLLPHALLAADLADRGVTYRDGIGYALHDNRVDAVVVGRLAADVLGDAADHLEAISWRHLARLGVPDTSAAVALHEALLEALRATAHDLRASARAAGVLARYLRPVLPLPAPVVSPTDDADLEAFLARFDGSALLLRRDLWRHYEGHVRPGGLTKGALFSTASARWGDVRKVHGEMVYRPASRAVVPSEAPSAPVEADGPRADAPEKAEP